MVPPSKPGTARSGDGQHTAGLSRRQFLQGVAARTVCGSGLLLLGGCESRSLVAGGSAKVLRIGYLAPDAGPAGNLYCGAFRQALHELGLIEGQNIVMEYAFAGGRVDGSRTSRSS
jgi:hypothetical protein